MQPGLTVAPSCLSVGVTGGKLAGHFIVGEGVSENRPRALRQNRTLHEGSREHELWGCGVNQTAPFHSRPLPVEILDTDGFPQNNWRVGAAVAVT